MLAPKALSHGIFLSNKGRSSPLWGKAPSRGKEHSLELEGRSSPRMEGPPSVAGRTNATAVMFAPHAPHPTYVFPQGKHPENTHQSLFNRAPSPSNFNLTLQLQPQDTHPNTRLESPVDAKGERWPPKRLKTRFSRRAYRASALRTRRTSSPSFRIFDIFPCMSCLKALCD